VSPEHQDSLLSSRMGKLETSFARLEQRVSNHEQRLDRMAELAERIATLSANVAGLDEDVARVEGKFDKRWERLEASQENARKDSRSLRNILIGVGIAAVLSPLGAFLFAAAVSKP
jgi:uncharacterized coiled-coil protein SlyX